ncbi:RpoE-regulated lipoprotein [Xenorhabdus lircayensis]|uniref:RpoE-regulated lipoprotein n=1 Tax=Xenorhabdus lircayensis TaxID=2763499 RepID=A0ABS0U0R5_9GAMM|nr:RpoE-regulated lipoprotein [Xenorhabdus lircayensis]MBI6547466.1 RpoE-regulated lipoprotein [Xenorhabdus lircayensis]
MDKFFVFNLLAKQRVATVSSLVGCSLLLTACAGTSGVSWSSLSPFNWFGSSLSVSEQGVGAINKQTDMTQSAIEQGLDGKYRLRSGMETQNGKLASVIQGMENDQVKIEFYGLVNGKVSRIEVSDEGIKTVWGAKIGTGFADLYDKAFGACQRSNDFTMQPTVTCTAPQSQHVSYVFTGIWDGPEGLMPSDDALKYWKVSRIIWKS